MKLAGNDCVQFPKERNVGLVVVALDRTNRAAFTCAHVDHRAIGRRVTLPFRSSLHDSGKLAAELSVVLAVPDLAQRICEDVPQRTALQDAAGSDRSAGANHQRVPSDHAGLIEPGALFLGPAIPADLELMPDFLAP